MFILCFVLWMILNGRITWEIAGFGIAVSAAVSWAARRLTGVTLKKELTIIRRFPAVLAYAGYLLREIVLVCLHAARTGEHAFTDVALIFAMFSFLGAAVLVRIVTERRKDR